MRRDVLLLAEMIDAAEQAQHLVDGVTAEELEADRQRCDALLWNFTVLGEAAGQLSDEVIQKMPAVIRGAEQVHPGAIGAAGAAGGLAVHRHGPQPVSGQHLRLLGRAPGAVAAHAGRGRPAGAAAGSVTNRSLPRAGEKSLRVPPDGGLDGRHALPYAARPPTTNRER
jgi:hypothetical protein